MRKFGVILAAVACLMLTAFAAQAATATPAEDMKGVIGINVGAGIGVPTGKLADKEQANMKMGFLVGGGLEYFISKEIGLGVDASYTQMVNKDVSDLKAKTTQFGVHGKYVIPTGGALVPYLQVGVGMYNRKLEYKPAGLTSLSISDTKPGVNGGVGVVYKLTDMIGIGASGAYHFTIGKMEQDNVEVLKDWNYISFMGGITFSIKPAAK